MKNRPFHVRLEFALSGIREALRREQSFRIQCGLGALALSILFLLRPSPTWLAIFILMISAIWAMELMNTAIEALIDRLHPDVHDAIRIAKDCAAGAVLVLSLASLVLFSLFLWDRFG